MVVVGTNNAIAILIFNTGKHVGKIENVAGVGAIENCLCVDGEEEEERKEKFSNHRYLEFTIYINTGYREKSAIDYTISKATGPQQKENKTMEISGVID